MLDRSAVFFFPWQSLNISRKKAYRHLCLIKGLVARKERLRDGKKILDADIAHMQHVLVGVVV